MRQNRKTKFEIIKLNKNYHLRTICFLIIIILVVVEFFLSKKDVHIAYIKWFAIALFVIFLFYNYFIKKYEVIGELVFYDDYLQYSIQDSKIRLDFSECTSIRLSYGSYLGEFGPSKALFTGNSAADGTDNTISIYANGTEQNFRLLIRSKGQRNKLLEYLNNKKESGIVIENNQFNF